MCKEYAHKLGVEYECAYPSQMKGSNWICPEVKERLKELASSGKEEIILIPISFVNENLETLSNNMNDNIRYYKELGAQKKYHG